MVEKKTVCNRTFRIKGNIVVCMGYSEEAPKDYPSEDVIRLCGFLIPKDKSALRRGVCPKDRTMYLMTPSEALSIGVNFIRTVSLQDNTKVIEVVEE